MKTFMLSLLLASLLLPHLRAGVWAGVPRLAGIVNLPEHKAALLHSVSGRLQGTTWKLGEGQRCVDVEVVRISPAAGSVGLRLGWTNTPVTVSLARRGNHAAPVAGGLELEEAGLDPVLSLYAHCKERTLLLWPRLPQPPSRWLPR